MATTRTTIRNPGGIQSHGCFVSTVRDWALFSILPRLAVGGAYIEDEVKKLAQAEFAAGDTVAVQLVEGDYLILGKVVKA